MAFEAGVPGGLETYRRRMNSIASFEVFREWNLDGIGGMTGISERVSRALK